MGRYSSSCLSGGRRRRLVEENTRTAQSTSESRGSRDRAEDPRLRLEHTDARPQRVSNELSQACRAAKNASFR